MNIFACFFLAVAANAHKGPSKFDALKAKSNPRLRGATTPRFDTKLAVGDTDCGSGNEMDYRGTVSTAEDGNACQDWAENWANGGWISPEDYADAGLEGNFCRNPNGDQRAWCWSVAYAANGITITNKKYCDVPKCKELVSSDYYYGDYYNYSDNAAEGADRIIAAK